MAMDIGLAEGVFLALIAVILLRPEELRRAARTAGRWMRDIRKLSQEFTTELMREAQVEEWREEMAKIGGDIEREINLDASLGGFDQPSERPPSPRTLPDEPNILANAQASDEPPPPPEPLGPVPEPSRTATAEPEGIPEPDSETEPQ